MDHMLPVVVVTAQEGLAHPQPNMLAGVGPRKTRAEARVDIEAVCILMNRWEALSPSQDVGWHIGAERSHGLIASVHDPQINLALIPICPRRARRGGSVTGIEVEMDGIVVRIGSGASPEAIGAVIRALKAVS